MGLRMAQALKLDIPAGHHAIHVLDANGDTTTVYDPTDVIEYEKAREIFDRAMGPGQVAYAIPAVGDDEVVKTFDQAAKAERVIVAPAVRGG
jgi:hypothetical protein